MPAAPTWQLWQPEMFPAIEKSASGAESSPVENGPASCSFISCLVPLDVRPQHWLSPSPRRGACKGSLCTHIPAQHVDSPLFHKLRVLLRGKRSVASSPSLATCLWNRAILLSHIQPEISCSVAANTAFNAAGWGSSLCIPAPRAEFRHSVNIPWINVVPAGGQGTLGCPSISPQPWPLDKCATPLKSMSYVHNLIKLSVYNLNDWNGRN